jgi:hypothetical protein
MNHRSINWALRTQALLFAVGLTLACDKEAPKPAPPPEPAKPAAPAPVAAAAVDGGAAPKPKMVANPDGLSLAERIAKRQAEEKKLADQLAGEEKKRLLAYDKGKMALHTQTWAAIKKFRVAYDKAKNKEDVEKIRLKQEKDLVATGKKMATIDPKGGNSNVTTDYDVILNALANDYPDALSNSFGGDKSGLDEQTKELDKRSQKIEEWLGELKSAKLKK